MGLRIGSPPAAGAVAVLIDFVAGSIRKAPEAQILLAELRHLGPDDRDRGLGIRGWRAAG